MKYNDLINELLDLLDENDDIKKIKELKKKLIEDEKLQKDLEAYRLTKTISLKKKLFEHPDYSKYLKCESNLNFLINDIKSKFKFFSDRKCLSESN